MALIDKDQVKAEFERRYKEFDGKTGDIATASRLAYLDILSYLDTLPEQPVTDCHDLEEEADDLEATIRNKADEMFFASGFYEDVHHDFRIDMSKEEFVAYARHFAEWGAEHLKR